MRIIAGSAGGLKIYAPPGKGARPTSDRVRESLFNILADVTRGARVLDLFSGTGAVGIEALSRGAVLAVLVDCSPECAAYINKNAVKTGFTHNSHILVTDAVKAINKCGTSGTEFDIIFVDPPYGEGLIPQVLEEIMKNGILAADGVIITERGGSEAGTDMAKTVYDMNIGLHVYRTKKYGGTVLDFIAGITKETESGNH